MAATDQRGAAVDLSHWPALPHRAVLFGEAQARRRQHGVPHVVLAIAGGHGVPARASAQ